jgi:hypothetical protein
MNPSVLGALAATLLAGLWLLSRRRPPQLVVNADASQVAALNRAQIALVRGGMPAAATAAEDLAAAAPAVEEAAAAPPAAPLTTRERLLLTTRLRALYGGDGASRRTAIRLARRWGHRSTLPLLRRALRDPDPAVVREAALAMEAFRGKPAPPDPISRPGPAPAQVPAPPRRVARTL